MTKSPRKTKPIHDPLLIAMLKEEAGLQDEPESIIIHLETGTERASMYYPHHKEIGTGGLYRLMQSCLEISSACHQSLELSLSKLDLFASGLWNKINGKPDGSDDPKKEASTQIE